MQVCNGFGPAGHMVSFRVRKAFPKFLFEATEEAHKPSKFELRVVEPCFLRGARAARGPSFPRAAAELSASQPRTATATFRSQAGDFMRPAAMRPSHALHPPFARAAGRGEAPAWQRSCARRRGEAAKAQSPNGPLCQRRTTRFTWPGSERAGCWVATIAGQTSPQNRA